MESKTTTTDTRNTTTPVAGDTEMKSESVINNKRPLDETTTTTDETVEPNKKLKTGESETNTTAENEGEDEEEDEDDEDELDKLNDTASTTSSTTTTTTNMSNRKKNNKPPPTRPPKLSKEELTELQNKSKVTTQESRKKKVAIILGYSGTNYVGMQKNPGLKTIEEELEHALFRTGGISPDNMYYQQKVDWVRCARTDKGVSAIRNVVSLKLECGPPELETMRQALNKELPSDITAFHIMRVNNSFHAKNAVDARSYIYVTPTHVFEPKFATNKPTEEKPWKFDNETLKILNRVLSFYLGNHRFHNYTSRKESNDVSVFRKIHSFVCSEPFISEGIEMVSINVVGESFMLHQIRKMVGCLISFMRRGIFQDCEDQEKAFAKIKSYIDATFCHQPLNLPMAPGAGLLLDFCIFNLWNEKNKDVHGELKIENEEVEEFKKKIFKEIALVEAEKQEFKNWIEKNLDPYQLQYELLEQVIKNPPEPPKWKKKESSNPKRLSKRDRKDFKIQSRKFEIQKEGVQQTTDTTTNTNKPAPVENSNSTITATTSS